MSDSTAPTLPTSLDSDLEAGQEVGEYVIEGKLGQGAFGVVYKATHPLIGKVVAIKVLATKLSVDPEMVSRFVAEARAVNQIRHRNIIDIFSFGKIADGRQYYVMEYLDGEPLDALVDRMQNMSLADALPILRPIAKALDAAHAKGIAHRDLKAENVFLGRDSDGQLFPKLLDFGIAKLMGREEAALKHKTRTGAPIGTPYYMSPEQCRGKDVDHRTDIYAFGVLVYRMLTGVYPFDGDDYMAILMQQLNVDPPPMATHLPELPAKIDDIVLWLLAKEPSERPPDLRTAVHALEDAARDAGMDIGPAVTWDVQSNPNATAYQSLIPPRRSGVASVPATTTNPPAAPATTISPTAKKSKAPLIGAVVGVVVVIAAVLVFVLGKHPDTKQPAPAPEPQVAQPTPAPPPPPDAAPVVVAPADAAPAAPKTVVVTVTGVPDGTEVLVGSTVIGAAPGPVQLDRGPSAVVLTFRADGYLPASTSVVPDGDKPLEIKLKQKKAATSGGHKPNKDDIIDVFGKGK